MREFLFGAVQKLVTQFKETYAQVKKERQEKERSTLQKNFVNKESAQADVSSPDIEARKTQGYKTMKRQKGYGNVEGNERNFNASQRNM